MQALEALQRQFLDSLFQENPASIKFIKSTQRNKRLDIYRQNVFENLRNALSITFPGIWKLLGETCANRVARHYCATKHLPTTGCLDDFGAGFPSFLNEMPQLNSLPYLEDYANYEWSKHCAMLAPAGKGEQLLSLDALTEEALEKAIIELIPSLKCYQSRFPIAKVDEIVTNPEAKDIELAPSPSYAIIARPHKEIITYWLSAPLWNFIGSLESQTLHHAYQQILQNEPDFNLAEALTFLFNYQLIGKIHIPNKDTI